MSIFENIISQYIDNNGKTRILNYPEGVSIYVLPLPPFDLDEAPVNNTHFATINKVAEFVKNKNLKIIEQDGDEAQGLTCGIWVKSLNNELRHAYIPIDIKSTGKSNVFKDIPYNDGTTPDPIFVDMLSTLDIMRTNSKIAEYLKQYSLVEWANDPDNFGIKNYALGKNHDYKIDSIVKPCEIKRGNKNFYSSTFLKKNSYKLVVPDKDTAERLIMFVKTTNMNHKNLMEEYLTKTTFDGRLFYTSIKDFRPEQERIVFINAESLIKWKMERLREIMNSTVDLFLEPDNVEPYYYRNLNINNGKLLIIQNTEKGDLIGALSVSKEWELHKINLGYTPHKEHPNKLVIDNYPENGLCFDVYTEEGMVYISDKKPTELLPRMHVFGYENGQYAAILPLTLV